MRRQIPIAGLKEFRAKLEEELTRADSYVRDSAGKLQVHTAWAERLREQLQAIDYFITFAERRNAEVEKRGEVSQARPDSPPTFLVDGEEVLDIPFGPED